MKEAKMKCTFVCVYIYIGQDTCVVRGMNATKTIQLLVLKILIHHLAFSL